jgi:TPR repeat protein
MAQNMPRTLLFTKLVGSSLFALSLMAGTAFADMSDILAQAKAASVSGDIGQALTLYEEAAAEDVPEAEMQLARIYMEGGESVAVDYEQARFWADKASEAGETRGLTYLGKIWMEGLGVTADSDKALAYFKQADAAGDMKAGRYIGLIAQASGDDETAATWFLKAASAGDITSQYYIGKAYQAGAGVMQDFVAAMAWYQKSADRGDIIASDGMVGEASLYELGEGVEQDLDKARMLYQQAADLGKEAAQAALDRLAE